LADALPVVFDPEEMHALLSPTDQRHVFGFGIDHPLQEVSLEFCLDLAVIPPSFTT
jgi:hypothetical protein